MNEYDKLLWEIHFKRGGFYLIDLEQMAKSLKE